MRGKQFTDAERAAIVREVCDRYRDGLYTLGSCCRSVGVGERTFRRWVSGELAELADAFRDAQRARGLAYRGELQERGQTALERLLTGAEVRETVTVRDGAGTVLEVRERVRRMPPHAGAVIAALRAVHPAFTERDGHGDTVSDAVVAELLRALQTMPLNGRG